MHCIISNRILYNQAVSEYRDSIMKTNPINDITAKNRSNDTH